MIPIKVMKISLVYIIGTVIEIRLHFTNRHAITNRKLVETPVRISRQIYSAENGYTLHFHQSHRILTFLLR